MKRLWMLAMLMIVLSGCGGSAAPGSGQCNQGLCIKLEVAEPIRWGEPVTVTIEVMTEFDVSELGISIYTFPKDVIIEGPVGRESTSTNGLVWKGGAGWLADAKSKRTLTFVRKIQFPLIEGEFDLQANATTPQGHRVTDSVHIYLTREGGKVYYQGTPLPTSALSGIAF